MRSKLVLFTWALVVALPLAFLGTLLALPLWSAIEARLGIESVGHSGPASWCFWLTYAVAVVATSAAGRWLARRPRRARGE